MPVAMRALYIASFLMLACFIAMASGHLDNDNFEDDNLWEWPVLCPPDNYYNTIKDQCVKCSGCPPNTIITEPCHRFKDTKCGPFYDFSSLQNQIKGESTESHEDTKKTESERDMFDDSNFDGQAQEDFSEHDQSHQQMKTVILKMSLIISGFVILIVATIITCVVYLKRRSENDKKLVCEYMPTPGTTASVVEEC
ncbi:hypothetical protein Btru_069691 [Bulinus truncatus]|nr:hypothetical protein Btru_069691 [Bulinus truncatus]